ncbi:hypothetical protein [Geodermatophilus sp. FMUSA9-8]|uniref:hypothetical protein n=1 Tax=Geodermatophilus sp. FMUSA9-8 TaxID=3120155 RepID=UPI00300B763A
MVQPFRRPLAVNACTEVALADERLVGGDLLPTVPSGPLAPLMTEIAPNGTVVVVGVMVTGSSVWEDSGPVVD